MLCNHLAQNLGSIFAGYHLIPARVELQRQPVCFRVSKQQLYESVQLGCYYLRAASLFRKPSAQYYEQVSNPLASFLWDTLKAGESASII
jgi:hypothetical protein